MRKDRSLGVAWLVTGVVLGASLFAPADAHITDFKHLKLKHFFTKKAANKRFINVGEKATDANLLDGKDSSEFLPATGGALSGPLMVPSIIYTAPKTHRLNVPAEAFRPREETESFNITDTGARGGGTSGFPLVAPISLPDGAIVTGLILWAYDVDGGSPDEGVRLRLVRRALGATTPDTMAQAQSVGSSGNQEVTDATVEAAAVDNATYTYSLKAVPWTSADVVECCWTGGNTTVKAAHILYTLAGPA